ncbi:hypothetical protein Tco_0064829 [Tanacetum coccineum]
MSSSSSKPRKPTVTNIDGIPIEFLFQPYGSQISFMSRKNHKAKYGYGSGGGFISKVDPEAMDDPFGRGGGFVPEAKPSVNSGKDLANVGVIDVRGVDDTTFMKEASLEDRKYNGNVKCKDKEQISMRELEYRVKEHYEREDDDDHDGTKDFRDSFHG